MIFTARTLPSVIPSFEGVAVRPPSSEPKISTGQQINDELCIHMLDSQLAYGNEFYGCDVSLALTPMTERCFLTLTQVIEFIRWLVRYFNCIVPLWYRSFGTDPRNQCRFRLKQL